MTGILASRSIKATVRETAARMPDDPVGGVPDVSNPRSETYIFRVAFDVSLVLSRLSSPAPTVVDMGGGIGLFSATLATLGANSILVEDFTRWRPLDTAYFAKLQSFWASHGVQVIDRDLMQGLGDIVRDVDAITSFHFLEHLHASPKTLFHDAADRLKPGGVFVLAGPNSANARKRAAAVFGRVRWSNMEEWYEQPVFDGHVREPNVSDLRYIARDLGLTAIRVHGRNFLGRSHPRVMGVLAQVGDLFLRSRPALCSDIYVIGQKPLETAPDPA